MTSEKGRNTNFVSHEADTSPSHNILNKFFRRDREVSIFDDGSYLIVCM